MREEMNVDFSPSDVHHHSQARVPRRLPSNRKQPTGLILFSTTARVCLNGSYVPSRCSTFETAFAHSAGVVGSKYKRNGCLSFMCSVCLHSFKLSIKDHYLIHQIAIRPQSHVHSCSCGHTLKCAHRAMRLCYHLGTPPTAIRLYYRLVTPPTAIRLYYQLGDNKQARGGIEVKHGALSVSPN